MKSKLIKKLLQVISPKNTQTVDDNLKFTKIIPMYGVSDFGTIDNAVQTIPYYTWFLKTNNRHLFCADNHIVAMADGSFKMVKDIVIGEFVDTVTGGEEVVMVTNTGVAQHMYSLSVYSDDVEKNNLYFTNGIMSKNTATSAAYMLWKTMFFPNTTILICANVANQAQEVLDKIKYSYEACPDFLKPGVVEYNKRKIKFDNNSRVICQATTANSGRGLSINLLYCTSGDSMVTVYDTETGLEKLITIEELHAEIGDYADDLNTDLD